MAQSIVEINIDKLIMLVRENPSLWDRRDKRYHCRGLRGRTWLRVGRELGVSAEVAKKRWQGLRDVFRKELRKFGPNKNEDEVPSGLSSIWVHFKDMYFLTDSLEPFKPQADISSLEMETSSPCTTVDCKEEFCFYDEPLGDEEPHQSEQVSQDPMEFRNVDSSSSQNLSRKRTFADSSEYYMEKKERLESCGDRACTKEDSDRQFLISLLPFIKRFSLSKTLMLRQKLLQVLIDEEQNG